MTFEIWINSGGSSTQYQDGDNVSLIEITHSDQDYYQNGMMKLFDIDETYTLGDKVMILIDDTLQFNGYVGTYNRSIDGAIIDEYQLVGKTYDLWRYVTDTTALYTGQTAYIASSLISTYCPGISGLYVDPSDGLSITTELDFTNMVVGEALVSLIELDGYKFYVDEIDQLHYYKPQTGTYDFDVSEEDIISMTSITQSDEDIINDCLVLGGSDYSLQTKVSKTHPSSLGVPSGVLIAQRFTAVDERLSAVDLYLNRSIDPNNPDDRLYFEIWRDSNTYLYADNYDNYNKFESYNGLQVYNSYLMLDSLVEDIYNNYYSYPTNGWNGTKGFAQRFNANNSGNIYRVRMWISNEFSSETDVWIQLVPTGANNKPDNNNFFASTCVHIPANVSNYNVEIDLTAQGKEHYMISGHQYCIVIRPSTSSFPANLYSLRNVLGPLDYQVSAASYTNDGTTWTAWNKTASWQMNARLYFRQYTTYGSGVSLSYNVTTRDMYPSATSVHSGNWIYISGSNSGATHWSSMTFNIWNDLGFENTFSSMTMIKLSGNGYFSPRIDLLTVNVRDNSGGGTPQVGSKVEWSDDISWYDNDIPYPPSWSSWKSYTSPKLYDDTVDDWINGKYWMIFSHNSGNGESNGQFWELYYDPNSSYSGGILMSWNNGNSWSSNTTCPDLVPDGNISFKLGWTEGNIQARASNQQSIDSYGRHFRLINDSSITTTESALIRAESEISGSESVPMKGTLTIVGRTDMAPHYRFSSQLTNLNVEQIWDVVGYTQRIDEKGFITVIRYGKHEYDIVKHLSDLEAEVY